MEYLTGVVLAAGGAVDVSWEGETIVAVEPSAKALGRPRLLIPAFIDTHIHLDKALISALSRWMWVSMKAGISNRGLPRAFADGSTATIVSPSQETSTAPPAASTTPVRYSMGG